MDLLVPVVVLGFLVGVVIYSFRIGSNKEKKNDNDKE